MAPIPFSYPFARARLFYPANLFKRTFNSTRSRVPERRGGWFLALLCRFIEDYQISVVARATMLKTKTTITLTLTLTLTISPPRIQCRRATRHSVTIDEREKERKANGSLATSGSSFRLVLSATAVYSLRLFLLVLRERATRDFLVLVLVVESRDDGYEDFRPSRARNCPRLLSAVFPRTGAVSRCVPLLFLFPLRPQSASLFLHRPLPSSASPFPSVCLLSLLRVVIPFAKLVRPPDEAAW